MRCSKCGKEFGEGVNCQYCGIDRVTGLANYGGYNNPQKRSGYESSGYGGYTASKTTVCYKCGEIIPVNSEYCPYCRIKLFETCPQCGNIYSSQFPACNKCGTNRSQYYLKLNEEKRKREKIEQEQRMANEALKLKERLVNKTQIVCSIIGILALLGAVVSATIFPSHSVYTCPENASADIILDIVRGLAVGGLIGGAICEYAINWKRREQDKICQWKQEHPNDPRNKYL